MGPSGPWDQCLTPVFLAWSLATNRILIWLKPIKIQHVSKCVWGNREWLFYCILDIFPNSSIKNCPRKLGSWGHPILLIFSENPWCLRVKENPVGIPAVFSLQNGSKRLCLLLKSVFCIWNIQLCSTRLSLATVWMMRKYHKAAMLTLLLSIWEFVHSPQVCNTKSILGKQSISQNHLHWLLNTF